MPALSLYPHGMSAEDAFDHVGSDITDFRYEDAFIGIKKNKENKIDVYAKNVQSEYRLHLYINDSEQGAVITREPTPTRPKGHSEPFTVEELLRPFVKPLEDLLSNIEQISVNDRKFAGRQVVMASIHRIRFIRTKKDAVYFDPDVEYRISKIADIDQHLPQVGVMKGWFGREIALVFTANGSVHILDMKHVKRCAKLLERELRQTGLDKLYPG
jgi:hypothetical protein